jgi:polyisoprenoid-binding protein YceI
MPNRYPTLFAPHAQSVQFSAMSFTRSLFLAVLFLPLALAAADRSLKLDRSGSFVDADVKTTLLNFTAHLDAFQFTATVDDAGKIKTAVLDFKFTDLKTGHDGRNADMIKWLGGGTPTGRFELGILALAPDGQGQATGRLIFHGETNRIEFPVNVIQENGTYTITGETTIDYRDWKLKVVRKTLVVKVDPEVKIRFKFTASLPPAPAASEN